MVKKLDTRNIVQVWKIKSTTLWRGGMQIVPVREIGLDETVVPAYLIHKTRKIKYAETSWLRKSNF